MLDNPKVQVAAVLLLLGAVAYNVWYFGLRDAEGGGGPERDPQALQESGAAAPAAAGDTATGSGVEPGARGGLDSALAAAARGELPLRSPAELSAVERWLQERPDWGRDPLSRPAAARAEPEPPAEAEQPGPQPPQWRLGAVLLGERDQAVIDGRVYGEGDEIDGGTLVDIRRRSVVIRWRGQRVVLELREPGSGGS